jgi:3',5'-cyclic AMP phosphodiesterase CpdA
MEVFAISDVHVGFPDNWRALQGIAARPDDALILAGDIGETTDQLAATLDLLGPRFRKLVWCPGNHELWQTRSHEARGVAKYEELVSVCKSRGVLTPEDDYPIWEVQGERLLIAPMFLLYDYSFVPEEMTPAQAVAWAAESGIRCADESLLHPDPFPSREAWCAERCRSTEARLSRALEAEPVRSILINHFPLKQSLARLPAIPRFQIWCGTRRTEDWHVRFRAAVVVSGHLHIRSTRWIEGCRFEEVSLGYPGRQWDGTKGVETYVRRIMPGR